MKQLNDNHVEYCEINGVKPNPRIDSVREGIALCRKNNLEFILAVGGGSVIDCAKIIAAGVFYDGDPWDFFIDKAQITKALPVGTILTIAATGSEMNGNAVISNLETMQKLPVGSDLLRSAFSILDPSYTMTLNERNTASGIVDIMSHVFEQYFSKTDGTFIQNRLAEAILKTCIYYGLIALKDPNNYEARANIMWAGSLALNGLLGYGKVSDWATHDMEHVLSGVYDIQHGIGLGILIPRWMEYVLDDSTVSMFKQYAINVWGIDNYKDEYELAKKSIIKTKEFFTLLNMHSSLNEVGITEEKLYKMAEEATKKYELGNFKKLNKDDVFNIYKASLK